MSDSQSRIEELLNTLITDGSTDLVPQTEVEMYLKACIDKTGTSGLPEPTSRMTVQLKQLADELASGGGGGGGENNLLQQTYTINRSANVTEGDMINLGYALGLESGKSYVVEYTFNGNKYTATAKYEQSTGLPLDGGELCLCQSVSAEGMTMTFPMLLGINDYSASVEDYMSAAQNYGLLFIVDKHKITGDMTYSDDENNAALYTRALQSSDSENAVSIELLSITEVV